MSSKDQHEMYANDAPRSFQRSLRKTDLSFYDVEEIDDESELDFDVE